MLGSQPQPLTALPPQGGLGRAGFPRGICIHLARESLGCGKRQGTPDLKPQGPLGLPQPQLLQFPGAEERQGLGSNHSSLLSHLLPVNLGELSTPC